MTTQEYIRYLTEHLMERFIRKEKSEEEKNKNYTSTNLSQQWFGLFPLSLELWYKKK